ncbi:MAG: CDP-alcohol phosphatidyltransferase family protein [Trueperaceae bacterium]
MVPLDTAGVRGYLVHAYTASTLLFVSLAMQWIVEERYQLALLAMAATVIIDATDGALARHYRVTETAAGIQGDLLDNIVDFLSYVALPALFLLHADMLLAPATLWVSLVMFASAFGFSRTDAKIAGKGFFVGFPSYWNIVVFYLWMLGTGPLFNTALILVLASAVLVPLRFLYVTRLSRWRTLHFLLGGLWGLACLLALLLGEGQLQDLLLYASLGYVAFYLVHSLIEDARDRAHSAGKVK